MPYPMSVSHCKCKLNIYLCKLFGFLYKHCDTFYTHDYVGRMPYPMPVAYRNCKFNFCRLVLLIYARTSWQHAASHVRCAL